MQFQPLLASLFQTILFLIYGKEVFSALQTNSLLHYNLENKELGL